MEGKESDKLREERLIRHMDMNSRGQMPLHRTGYERPNTKTKCEGLNRGWGRQAALNNGQVPPGGQQRHWPA